MEDAWDKKYVLSVGKALIADLFFIFCFTMIYTMYNLVVKEIIVLPIDILTNQYFLLNNFILLLCLITYFIYKSRELF